jgi:Ran GTPase-activating protein (RanGAP) involved in mRNA processing and transport
VQRLLAALATRQRGVTKLNIGYNRVDDAAARLVCEYVVAQRSVRELHLDGNALSDAIVPTLCDLLRAECAAHLSLIDVGDNSLSDAGVSQLYDVIDCCYSYCDVCFASLSHVSLQNDIGIERLSSSSQNLCWRQ